MARPRKPVRLYLHPTEDVWLIRDGPRCFRTGCAQADLEQAEEALQAYLAKRYAARKRVSDPAALPVVEVLNAYASEHAINLKSAPAIGNDLRELGPFFAHHRLSDIRKDVCLAYVEHRRKQGKRGRKGEPRKPISNGTIRRELAILSAAIGYWHETHGPLTALPVVTLPSKPPPRPDYLDRREAAWLLAGSLGFYRDEWCCDLQSHKERWIWRRDRSAINRHIARFILVALATGSRKAVILSLRRMPNTVSGWVDLQRGLIFRAALDEVQTKKRKPPAALGDKILAHLRRWERMDRREAARLDDKSLFQTIVHWRGREVADIKNGWRKAVEYAGLPDTVLRHTMRHTRATWLMQADVPIWEAAGSIGMSPKMLEENYGHHNPRFQEKARNI